MTPTGHDFPAALPGEEKEHAERLFKLADANAKGELCKQNIQRAFDAYMAAAKQGHAPAMMMMGDIYRTGEIAQHSITAVHLPHALEWYARAEKAGLPDALFGMGRAYQDLKDHHEAIACFEKSAFFHGKREALREYGMCVFHGHGTTADPARGRELMKQAAMMDAELSPLGKSYLAANYGVEVTLPENDEDKAARHAALKAFQADCAKRRKERGL